MMVCVPFNAHADTSTMDSRKRKSESRELSLSVGDLYSLVTNQQRRMKNHNRRHTTNSLPSNGSRSPDFLSPLPEILGRAETSVSEPILSKTYSDSRKVPPLTPMSCLRSESAVKNEYYNMVSSLCRQCCDVLGPKACHQCIKVSDRRDLLRRSENIYPNLEASEENVTAANTLGKYLPNLTPVEIQDSIAMGHIARNSVSSEIRHRRELSMIINEDPAIQEMKKQPLKSRVVLQNEQSTQAYFLNIKALNEKIVSGDVPKDLKSFARLSMKSKPDSDEEPAPKKISFSETVCPTFVSPRKQQKERQLYSAFYAPPLLPVNRQNVEPMFFAGSNKPYILPERLPEKVVPGQDDPEVHPTYFEMSSPEISSRPQSKSSVKLPTVAPGANGVRQPSSS